MAKQKDKNLPVKKETLKVAQVSADEKFIQEAVDFINEKANKMLYKGSIEIGEYLLKHFYLDDIKQASSRNPHKPISYAKLCEREDLIVKPDKLSVMVRVAAQERFFNQNNIDVSLLSYTHKAEMIKISDDKKKILLIEEFNKNPLSTRMFSAEITNIRRKSVKKIASHKYLERYSNKLLNLFKNSNIADINIDKLKEMNPNSLDKLKDTTENIFKKLKSESQKYENFLKDINKIHEDKNKKDK